MTSPKIKNPARAHENVLKPGRNCFEIANALRATVLVDAKAYFAALEKAFQSAARSIVIIGWDFDGRMRLRPQDGDDAPAIGTMLRKLVEERPELEVRILVWSLAIVHTPSASSSLLLGDSWNDHERINLRLDTNHPLHAAHHQKIVMVDDALAFVGGMDLTVDRWDTPEHRANEPLRVTPDGEPCRPVHDVQMMLDGPIVAVVKRVAQMRWRDATGEELPEVAVDDRWLSHLDPDFRNLPVAIARTAPRLDGTVAIEETWPLTVDMLRSAKTSVYIEAQYFTAKKLRPILREVLSREHPPEIVVVCPLNANGVIERFFMGANRERLLRSISQADHAGKLRLYHSVVPDEDGNETEVLIHSKVMIVDDRVLRVGSANLNNRSIGLDTECDVAIESDRPEVRDTILRIRNRLLAEHLGCDPAQVDAAMAEGGSMVGAIERLSHRGQRHLRPLVVSPGPRHSFPGTRLVDPVRPFGPVEAFHRLWRRLFFQRESATPNSRGASNSLARKTAPPSARGTR
ncbi:MAG: phospholipase [Rhizobiaceae bacterium]|nr:phospholipase [Rhizobiaceae bacterium]